MTDSSVAELAALVGGRLLGDGTRRIVGIGDLRSAGPDRIGFVRHPRYAAAAATTKAGALLLSEPLSTTASQIVVEDVNVAYAKVAAHFHPRPVARRQSVHPTAVVDPEARWTEPVEIGPRAVIGKATLGAGTVVMAGAVVGDGAVLGEQCVLYPNVTIYHDVRLGARVSVHAGAVLGSDGFGYANEEGRWLKVPQLGSVQIEDDVEIGASVAIDRGTIGDTRIGARAKLDNLCHIAHNCTIGPDTALAAGVMIAGSTTLGARCVIAGCVAIGGHLTIAADVRIGGGSHVLKDVPEAGDYMGLPLMQKRQWMRHWLGMHDFLAMRDEFLDRRRNDDPGVAGAPDSGLD